MKYDHGKEMAREAAMEFQNVVMNNSLAWGDLMEYQDKLDTMARRYGLVKEFRENGII